MSVACRHWHNTGSRFTGQCSLGIAGGRPLQTFCTAHCQKREPGLGDLIAAIATPIARALKLPCLDPKTNQLHPKSACAKRRDAMNRA